VAFYAVFMPLHENGDETEETKATKEIPNAIAAEYRPPAISRYVDAPRLLEILFDEASRPSLRWLRSKQQARAIPFCRIGRRIFFDPILVKYHLDARSTVKGSR
jgi:hypothetical protein